MSSYQQLFTPIFITISICILIAGTVGLQFLDKLFAGSQNVNANRLFGITIIINITHDKNKNWEGFALYVII